MVWSTWGLCPHRKLASFITRLAWKPADAYIDGSNWRCALGGAGSKFCYIAAAPNSEESSAAPKIPHCIMALGIPADFWLAKCNKLGTISIEDLSNLEVNLDLLERWGLTYKGRKRVVQKSVTSLFLPVEKLDLRLKSLEHILDFERKQVVQVVRKFPEYLAEGLGDRLSHFLQSFSEEGHPLPAVQNMVTKYPQILGKIHQFEAVVSFFTQHLKCSQAQVMAAFLRHPQLVESCIENQIKPKVVCFENLGLSRAQILSILMTFPETMCLPFEVDVAPQIDKFHDLGISEENVAKVIRGSPLLLFRNFAHCVLDKLDWLEKNLFFRRETALKALVKHPRIFPASLDTWQETCEFYVDSGMSKMELTHFMKRSPKLLARKPEGMKEKFHFAKTALKKGSLEILRSVRYFTYSFEDRILFRAALADRAGKDITQPSFRDLMDPSDADFQKRFPEGEVQTFRARWNQLTKEEKLDCFQFKLY